MGRRILDDQQLIEMAELREQGWSTHRIAAHFTVGGTPIGHSAVNWQCLRVGADAPRHLRGHQSAATEPYRRGAHLVRPYTPEEDGELLRLAARGLPRNLIARQLGRPNNSIRGRLMTLARHEARREDEAAAHLTNLMKEAA